MAELVLGALGVVPLIGFTIKSYDSLYTTVKTFRDCDRNVERLRKRLRGQRCIFRNECMLLLRRCLADDDDGMDIEGMMADPAHEDWLNHELATTKEEEVKRSLTQSYDECIELVQDMQGAIEKIRSSMAPFEEAVSEQDKREGLKKAWKRINDGARICLRKKDYESELKDLKRNNATLKTIREQVQQMEKPRSVMKKRPAPRPYHWTDIQRASKTLHEALVEAWSCTQARHLRHSVKLFVEAQKSGDGGVQMDIAIFGHVCGFVAGQVDMIRLQVRSTIMTISPSQLLPPSPGCGSQSRHQKRRRTKNVRFDAETRPAEALDSNNHPGILPCPPSPDLRCSADICLELTTQCGQKVTRTTTACLGHLDVVSNDGYRHQFFPASQYTGTQLGPWAVGTGEPIPMNAILGDGSTSDSFLPIDRLKMARALVPAVLKFHGTPWLGEAWRLQDLAFFHDSQDLARSLRTLHVGVDFEHQPPQAPPPAAASRPIRAGLSPASSSGEYPAGAVEPRSPVSQASEYEHTLCGIANTTLYCLGVALLQIERSQPLEPEDVVEVRTVARSVDSLGRDYKELVEKCLWCDFGLGRDLTKPQLQQAVYTSVVDVLERLIARLDIGDGDDDDD